METVLFNYSTHHLTEPLSTTYIDVQMKKMLGQWLRGFSTAGEVTKYQPTTERPDSRLLVSMLKSPGTSPSTMYTPSTTVDGRIQPVVAVPSPSSTLSDSSDDVPGMSTLYRPKTSGFFRTMCFVNENCKYSLRSPGIDGEYILKLELYKSNGVMGLPSMDWWKYAETRAFVPIKNNSRSMGLAIQLQQELQKTMENHPDAEGDYVHMKLSK